MSRTTILLGPPGTGKTTRLLDMVERALKDGVPPERIAFFAFTRKAAQEAASRAVSRFGLDLEDLPWFRTLHSAAYHILGLTSHEVMRTTHFDELGSALGGFTFEYTYNETTERPPLGGALGDNCMTTYGLSRAQMVSVTEAWRRAEEPLANLRDAVRFAAALEEFKSANHLFDFADFLDEIHEPLDLDLLIIDEAQDLTKQQWAFVRRIGAQAQKVIIAGDDDQAIFQWAGADLRTFLGLRGDLEVLPVSYRLPPCIWDVCNKIIEQIKIRRPKTWSPRDTTGGSVQHITYPDQISFGKLKSWLLLVRNQIQVAQMVNVCRAQGVVYCAEGVWSNRAASVQASVQYERLRAGGTITPGELKLIIPYVDGLPARIKTPDAVIWDDIPWTFEGRPDWMTALKGLGNEEREYIRRLRREDESLTKPGRVIISTIHGIKGGEADNVLLATDMSKRVKNNMQIDKDQETRVWYVGASRARENLFLLAPQTSRFYAI